MTTLKLSKHQSLGKIGTVAGIMCGALVGGGNRVLIDFFAITGTIIGSFISKPASFLSLDSRSSQEQLSILKNHFDGGMVDRLNPIETNYNLYERDCIGNLLEYFEDFKNKILNKGNDCKTEDPKNKIISTKYIVFDTFYNITPEEIILDLIPVASIFGINRVHENTTLKSIFDVGLIYCAKPAINYILYKRGELNDYEEIELQFNGNEVELFKDCLPGELVAEVDRVSL